MRTVWVEIIKFNMVWCIKYFKGLSLENLLPPKTRPAVIPNYIWGSKDRTHILSWKESSRVTKPKRVLENMIQDTR